MLQIIVFALILGVILANMGDRVDIVKNFFGQFNDIMMEMTMAVMKLAPIGVFCLIAKTFAEIGFEVFIPLLKYMFCVLLALAVQCFVVYLGLLKIFSGLNPFIFIKNFFPVMAFAFSTSTSNATIPMNIDTLAEKWVFRKRFHLSRSRSERPLTWMEHRLCRVWRLCSPHRRLESRLT